MKRLNREQRGRHKQFLRVVAGRRKRKAARLDGDDPESKPNVESSEQIKGANVSWKLSRDERVLLFVPENLVLNENHEETQLFFNNLRQAAIGEGLKVRLDFSQTQLMEAHATLLLYATIDHVLINSGDMQKIVISYPKEILIEQICQQIGLFDRLGMASRLDVATFPEDVARWRVSYGHMVGAKQIHEFIVSVLNDYGEATVGRYNKGLKEAIGNCVEHAYVDDFGNFKVEETSRWWIFGGNVDGNIVFVVCDLGKGIPSTLGIRNNMSELKRRALRWAGKFDFISDAGRIEVACRIGKSRIADDQGRGRGLAQLISLMQDSEQSRLFIWSNKGAVRYSALAGQKPVKRILQNSVNGTIISWSSPILV